MSAVTVAFACNDDSGAFTGRCEMVNLVSEEHGNADLVCQMSRGQVLKSISWPNGAQKGVRLGRRTFTCHGWQDWYGNMAWDATSMALPEAERFLRYLLSCGYTVDAYDDGPFGAIIEEHERARSEGGR